MTDGPPTSKSTRRLRFSQGDVTRILKGAKAAGVTVEIRPDGTIVGIPALSQDSRSSENEWDNVK